MQCLLLSWQAAWTGCPVANPYGRVPQRLSELLGVLQQPSRWTQSHLTLQVWLPSRAQGPQD